MLSLSTLLLVHYIIDIRLYYVRIGQSNCTITGILYHLEYLPAHIEYLPCFHGNYIGWLAACLGLALAYRAGCHGGAFYNLKTFKYCLYFSFYSCTDKIPMETLLATPRFALSCYIWFPQYCTIYNNVIRAHVIVPRGSECSQLV